LQAIGTGGPAGWLPRFKISHVLNHKLPDAIKKMSMERDLKWVAGAPTFGL